MQITLKLYATLSEYLPPDAKRNVAPLELPDGTTVGQVVQDLRLPRELVHLVLVNGSYVSPEQMHQAQLRDGDALAIWPPVAGG